MWPMTTISSVPSSVLADDQRADDVVGGEAAGVADDVGVAGPQAERLLDVEPRVHAGDDRETAERRGRQRRPVERLGVALVLGKDPAELAAVRHARRRVSRTGAEQQRQPVLERAARGRGAEADRARTRAHRAAATGRRPRG